MVLATDRLTRMQQESWAHSAQFVGHASCAWPTCGAGGLGRSNEILEKSHRIVLHVVMVIVCERRSRLNCTCITKAMQASAASSLTKGMFFCVLAIPLVWILGVWSFSWCGSWVFVILLVWILAICRSPGVFFVLAILLVWILGFWLFSRCGFQSFSHSRNIKRLWMGSYDSNIKKLRSVRIQTT